MRPLSGWNVSKTCYIKCYSVSVFICYNWIMIPYCGYRNILTGQNHRYSETIFILKIWTLLNEWGSSSETSLIESIQLLWFPVSWDWKLMGPQIILKWVPVFISNRFLMHPFLRWDVTQWCQDHTHSPAIFILFSGNMIIRVRYLIGHSLFKYSGTFLFLIFWDWNFIFSVKFL